MSFDNSSNFFKEEWHFEKIVQFRNHNDKLERHRYLCERSEWLCKVFPGTWRITSNSNRQTNFSGDVTKFKIHGCTYKKLFIIFFVSQFWFDIVFTFVLLSVFYVWKFLFLFQLGNPVGKVVTGKIYHVTGSDLYIDFNWKFHCVCRKPLKNSE